MQSANVSDLDLSKIRLMAILATFSRFLMKELGEQTEEGWEYHWRFLAFCTLWLRKGINQDPTVIVLCFDLVEMERKPGGSMHTIFHQHLKNIAGQNDALKCPYGIYAPLVDVIGAQYNRAVWSYRGPVKSMETVRIFPTHLYPGNTQCPPSPAPSREPL